LPRQHKALGHSFTREKVLRKLSMTVTLATSAREMSRQARHDVSFAFIG
jgi:hypothetical protein